MKPNKLLIRLKFYREFIEYIDKHKGVGIILSMAVFTLSFGIALALIVWSLSANYEQLTKILQFFN